MDAKQFDALVNKGAVTQVGIVEDAEKLDAQDFTGLHMTQHEVVAEVLTETSDDAEIEDIATLEEEPVVVMNEVPTDVPTETVEPAPAVIKDAPMVNETPAEVPTETVEPAPAVIEEEPVVVMNEVPVETASEPVAEETPVSATKKSKKAKNVAPSVDPVE